MRYLPILLLVGCSIIPQGVDPFQYRLREAELNLQAVEQAVPVAGFTLEDQKVIMEISAKLHQLIDAAQLASTPQDAIGILETGLPALQMIVDNMAEGQTKVNAQRMVAVGNVTVMVLRNQEKLQDEFGP